MSIRSLRAIDESLSNRPETTVYCKLGLVEHTAKVINQLTNNRFINRFLSGVALLSLIQFQGLPQRNGDETETAPIGCSSDSIKTSHFSLF